MRFIMKNQMPTKRKTGMTQESRSRTKVDSTSPLNLTSWPLSSSDISGSTRTVRNSSPWSLVDRLSFMRPWIMLEVMATSVTRFSFRAFKNSL